MEELQAQIDAMKLEISELKAGYAYCQDQVKLLEQKVNDCCSPVCRPALIEGDFTGNDNGQPL